MFAHRGPGRVFYVNYVGAVHAWVGQIILKCNEFKKDFVRPTEVRARGRALRSLAQAAMAVHTCG